MHELPIVEHVLARVIYHAKQRNARSVTRIDLNVGELSGFVDESIQFYWRIVADGTIAADAHVCIHRVPGQMRCRGCGMIVLLSRLDGSVCPSCDSVKMEMYTGTELVIDSIGIEFS